MNQITLYDRHGVLVTSFETDADILHHDTVLWDGRYFFMKLNPSTLEYYGYETVVHTL